MFCGKEVTGRRQRKCWWLFLVRVVLNDFSLA